MKRRGFARPNLGIALAAVVISVAMWLNVQREQALIATEQVEVPVYTYSSSTSADPQYIVRLGNKNHKTTITVKGTQEERDRFNTLFNLAPRKGPDGVWEQVIPTRGNKPRSLFVQIDLADVTADQTTIRPQPMRDDAIRQTGVQIEIPDQLILVEERMKRMNVPIEVKPGNVPDGYSYAAATLDPATVTISGVKSIVKSISKVRGTIDLKDYVPGKTYDVKSLQAYSMNGEPVSVTDDKELTIEETGIRATPRLEQAPLERSVIVNLIIDQRTKLAPGYTMGDYDIEPSMITASGPGAKDLIRINTKLISVDGLSGTVVRRVKLEMPAGVTKLSASTVKVTLKVEKIKPIENPAPATTGGGTGPGGHTGP
jgi:hypothetical protein